MIKNIKIKRSSAYKIIGLVLFVAVVPVTLFWFTTKNPSTKNLPVRVSNMYVTDFGQDKVLVGYFKNVFVGRVVKQVGVSQRESVPLTQFEVEIIDNIKGNLDGKVIVEQEGGYDSKGRLYVVNSDVAMPGNDDSFFLRSGATYLMAVSGGENVTRVRLGSHPNRLYLISDDKTLSMAELQTLVENDKTVLRFKEAYINEILWPGHVESGNTKNSFQSLSSSEQERLKAEVEYKKSLLQTN